MNNITKKAFSLIEVIFAISIIAIIASVAIPKFNNSINKANIVKIQSDILTIRDNINSYKTKNILSNNNYTLDNLDKFIDSKIWTKLSNTLYSVTVNKSVVVFTFDIDNYTFNCDKKDKNCIEYFN